MKNILLIFILFFLLLNQQFSYCEENSQNQKPCEKCIIEDDEYCVYNECYFDRRYKNLKKMLCLTQKQENQLDNSYKNFKEDIEIYYSKYRQQKDCILKQIENNKEFNASQLKEIKKNIKDRRKNFEEDVKDILCKNQYKLFKKQKHKEEKTLKKILKYAKIYKLPCEKYEE